MPKIKGLKLVNNLELYDEILEPRGIKKITFESLRNFYKDFDQNLYSYETHVWKRNDTMVRLANNYYNNYRMWDVIAFFNKKPTDHHYKLGETVLIPLNPNEIKKIIEETYV